MHSIKSFLTLITALLFTVFISACGDDNGSSAGSGQSMSSESAANAGLSHDVVYEEEIYKNWPK